jgi:hypothetical protein
VALVTQGGTRIGANGNHARALVQYRKRKCCNGKVLAFAAIIERKGIGNGFVADRDPCRRAGLRSSMAVNLVASLAGNRRLIRQIAADQAPRTLLILGLNEIAHGSIEVSPVATQAIVHEVLPRILPGIGEDLGIGRRMGSGVPAGVFLLMALLAVRRHRENVRFTQADSLGPGSRKMHANVAEFGGETGFVAIQAGTVAMRRAMHAGAVDRHFVAA